MLRRLLLGQPRRCEIKDAEKEICEEGKRILDLPRKKSTDLEDEHKAREDDIYDSDSETDGSDTEDSDSDTLDNSSKTDSCEDCSADVLAWKGFEVVKDKRPNETAGNFQEENGEERNQENPFKNAFDTQGNELAHEETRNEGTYRNNYEKKINNSNNRKENDASCNKNDDHNDNDEYDNKSDGTNIQAYNKQTHQPNDNETAAETESKLLSGQPTETDQLKIPLQLPKSSTANQKPPNSKAKGVSRNYSIRENKTTSSSKRQTFSKINTEGKHPPATKIPDKYPVCKAQNSVIRRQDIGKDKAGFRGTRPGNKPKQANVNPSHISVSDLESVLGVNVTELREVIMKYKSEKVSTAEDFQGHGQAAESKLNLQGMGENNLVDGKKSRCENDKIKEGKREIIDNKDEISSDSGVSEPDRQPHYTALKAIIKRKKYLESQIKALEDRIVVMGDHKKDIQVVHDLFDLHNDGLEKVERSNGGLACLESLKSILACQLREIDDDEFRAKLKSLEDLGIPNISEINERIEKLRKRIRHALDDERKCRSKGVQKLRFEIGKVQGMCEAVLDLVYTE